jgi:hypothetical protein
MVSLEASLPSSQAALPDMQVAPPIEAHRVLEVFADGAEDMLRFNEILQREVDLVCERVVIPLVKGAWPDIESSGFMPKLRTCIGAYTHVGLSCVACSQNRPWPFAALSKTSRALRLSTSSLAAIVRVALPFAFRVSERERAERLALASALIIVFDEALDSPDTPARSRGAAVMNVLEGMAGAASTPCLRALDAVWKETQSRVESDDDKAHLHQIFDLYRAWADAEQKNVNGEPDPTGYCHRKEAMVASMAGLAWAIRPYAGDAQLKWLVHIAECAQMVDDVLDMEKDRLEGRATPAQTGMWNLETIRSGFADVEKALLKGLADGGDTHGAYVDMCLMVCRAQCHRATRILIDHP